MEVKFEFDILNINPCSSTLLEIELMYEIDWTLTLAASYTWLKPLQPHILIFNPLSPILVINPCCLVYWTLTLAAPYITGEGGGCPATREPECVDRGQWAYRGRETCSEGNEHWRGVSWSLICLWEIIISKCHFESIHIFYFQWINLKMLHIIYV